jgi:hypothetical protein
LEVDDEKNPKQQHPTLSHASPQRGCFTLLDGLRFRVGLRRVLLAGVAMGQQADLQGSPRCFFVGFLWFCVQVCQVQRDTCMY